MKRYFVNFIKYFKWAYSIYYYTLNFFICLLRMFVKPDDKLILFNSFGGKKYDDSPKAIYEAMLRDKRFNGYSFVWAFHNPRDFCIKGAKVIKIDTYRYFSTALKARCWITNSGIERGLNFKGKNTFYFNTWHGTPLKKMGVDILAGNKSFRSKNKKSNVDIMTAQSDYEADIFSRVFGIERSNFLMCGLPRNDCLVRYTETEKNILKKKLGLPENKKVILYAPTFREYERDNEHNCVLKPPMDLKKWEEKLKDEYCLLFRAHYEVGKIMDLTENDFLKNMTLYPSLEELMIVSDILISDYSSIMFDFSVMDKIILLFTYDYDKYEAKRGMYFDIRKNFDGSNSEDGVIEILKNIHESEQKKKTIKFREKYVNYSGDAVRQSLDCISSNL